MATSAKSDVGIGVPNFTGDKPRPKACFLLQILTKIWGMFYIPHPKRGVINLQLFDYGRGLWKYRKIRRLPVERYANSISPYHPKLAFSVIGFYKQVK